MAKDWQGSEEGFYNNMAGEVAYIFDMDGYQVGSRFRCKELGWKVVGCARPYNFYFYWGSLKDLPTKDKFAVMYVEKNIFDIPYNTYWPGMLKGETVIKLVKQLYGGQGRVAYKGGHHEKDILDFLEIPSINLEDFGVPKVGELIEKYSYDEEESCGKHKLSGVHCPREEVMMFDWWLTRFCWDHGVVQAQGVPKNPYLGLEGLGIGED